VLLSGYKISPKSLITHGLLQPQSDASSVVNAPPYHPRSRAVIYLTPTMADVQMQDVGHEINMSKGPSFSDQEKEILHLYDQVQKLELELALAKARTRLAGESSRG
jgi:hypothetical protein